MHKYAVPSAHHQHAKHLPLLFFMDVEVSQVTAVREEEVVVAVGAAAWANARAVGAQWLQQQQQRALAF